MSTDGLSGLQPDPAGQAVYIWQRLDPRNNRLIRDKLLLAGGKLQTELAKSSNQIRFANRANLNKYGVEMMVAQMWEQKVDEHVSACYEIFCHHWDLRGEKKTGAFVRVAVGMLLPGIERLGASAADAAGIAHHRHGSIGTSPAGLYETSARAICDRWRTKLDIEARELDLALSKKPAEELEYPATAPAENRGKPTGTPMTDPSPSQKIGEIVVEGGPLSAEDTDPTGPAMELLQKLGFGVEQHEWPSPHFGVVLPEVLGDLKRAHRILTTRGFLIVGDPLNPLGDGRRWVLRCEPTNQLPNDADPTDLAQRCLQSEGLKVAAKPVLDGHTLLIALWDSGPASQEQITHADSRHTYVTQPQGAEQGPHTSEASNLTHEDVGKKRTADVVRARREIAEIRGHMDCDEDYDRLKAKYPTFMLFKVCDREPELKLLLLGIKGHHQRRALRFAKQVAAAHNEIKLNTIEKAWDKYNPNKKARQCTGTQRSPKRATVSRPKPR